MSILSIKIYPDPVLRKKSKEVGLIDGETQKLVNDMVETVRVRDGVGLAAPQVGLNKRIFVINAGQCPQVFINSQILKKSGSQADEEGCLSVPGIYLKIKRANKIVCQYLNGNGKVQTIEATGLLARVIQHEADHLDGILIIDKVNFLKKRMAVKKLRDKV